MWKTYDLTGKTKSQFIKQHPYSTNPVKSVSKLQYHFLNSILDHEFMMFHLGDSYFFMNEIIKTQPTSQEESDLYNAIIKVRRFKC